MREAQRRLLQRTPDYFKSWRRAHPETERERRSRWRAANPGLLLAQRQRRRDRNGVDATPLPPSHAHHPLFESAWEILHRLGIRRDAHLVAIHDPRWEDACSEVVLAMLEGRDPVQAARNVLAVERRHAAVSFAGLDLDRLAIAG